TFPTRHRLLMKTAEGTTIDGKPYVGRWESVLNALGLTLTGSILFANHVLLTEGDSDPIYIYALIQKSVAAGKCRLDINSLGIMSTGESRHADVLLRVLSEVAPKPDVAMLFDGDKGGESRFGYVSELLKQRSIPSKVLTKETVIEDHLPMLREAYVPALAKYVAKLMVLEGKAKPDEEQLMQSFLENFDAKFNRGKATSHVADWAEKVATEIGGLARAPSKIGIAREYASLLMQMDNADFKLDTRSKALIEWIHENVRVPELRPVEKKVLDD
ncbi:MAG: TOPRIM nucleotidyl transferase/hydrolase domain-containing protein, partial [Pirellulales bacterium]